ncbi:MAG: sensor histidine kinase [Butyrivibrio sp.]|nr:sensor histidine kinase [Butyrivibrio sp.]
MYKSGHSIRTKIILWALGFALVLALLVAFASYALSFRYLKQNQTQSAMTNIHLLGNELDSEIGSVITFSNWICLDTTIGNYLQNIESKKATDSKGARHLSLASWNHLNDEFNIVTARNLINRVIVSTSDGKDFLQCVSIVESHSFPKITENIMSTEYFGDLIGSPTNLWVGIKDNPLYKASSSVIVPIARPIFSASSSTTVGWVYMELPLAVITDRLNDFSMEEDGKLFITIGENNSYLFTDNQLIIEDVDSNAISYKLPTTGWIISYLPSARAFQSRMKLYIFIILMIFFIILCAGILLTYALHHTIARPVSLLINRLEEIGSGDFSRDAQIEWDNELGAIGRGINNLSDNVSALLEKRLMDEKTKQDLEYQVLQSQINPHFLYNTLNTIKWMATIQGSDGIADMSTALSRLMKNISKGKENLITLKEEYALLNDYFTIMKYRYGGTISLEYVTEDDSLLLNRINRFSLQPIIENAIFHGIEPKGSAGKIVIHTYEKDNNVVIDVTDNGVGMDEKAIEAVLSGKSKTSTEFFRQIGVYNVNERIKYTFGKEYGISISSIPGEYTTMSFVIPHRLEEENAHV